MSKQFSSVDMLHHHHNMGLFNKRIQMHIWRPVDPKTFYWYEQVYQGICNFREEARPIHQHATKMIELCNFIIHLIEDFLPGTLG